jgi:hypothetical protein
MKPGVKEWVGVVFVGLLLLGWFAKYTVISGFDVIPGNIGDARFLLYLCEHWYQVFTGRANWLSPGTSIPRRALWDLAIHSFYSAPSIPYSARLP